MAGKFYPANRNELEKNIATHLISPLPKKQKALGIVSPHAGFTYSGDVAGAVYSRVEIPSTVVLIGPNHTGYGESISIMTNGTWTMPMGDVPVDEKLAVMICEETPIARPDSLAHQFEHSLETQLPFLQYFNNNIQIVPICLKKIGFPICKQLSVGIVKAIKRFAEPVLIVASSDMTHFETHITAKEKDGEAISKIQSRDALGLHETIGREKISMCGVNPVTVMLLCSEKLGARQTELVSYMTSGEVNGDKNRVVGYAGIIIS